jgi:hypothetical protein
MNRRPAIDLRIDELVLHGFEPGQRGRIGASVEAELGRLLASPEAAARLGGGSELARVDAGAIDVAADGAPRAVGAAVARAVYGGLVR